MGKLALKETPAEARDREYRKARRAARKKRKETTQLYHNQERSPSPRHWRLSTPEIYRVPSEAKDAGYLFSEGGDAEGPQRPPLPSDDAAPRAPTSTSKRRSRSERADNKTHAKDFGYHYDYDSDGDSWMPPPSASKVDYEQIRTELEGARFNSKLFDAMDDDTRLEAIEASFNSYHVPQRWNNNTRNGSAPPPDMDDEEYTEWVRRGMWQRTHRAEMEENERREKERQSRRDQERKQRKAREKAERDRERRREVDRAEREQRKLADAFIAYQDLWASLQANPPATVRFSNLPWPVYPPPTSPASLTLEAISSFLLSEAHSSSKSRKQRIREALLAYHPDRFMGKWMPLVGDAQEQDLIREAVGSVTRILNDLAEAR